MASPDACQPEGDERFGQPPQKVHPRVFIVNVARWAAALLGRTLRTLSHETGGVLWDFAGIKPMMALFWTAVINGFLSPPLLLIIMLIANNRSVMGDHANSLGLNVLGRATTGLMLVVATSLVLTAGH